MRSGIIPPGFIPVFLIHDNNRNHDHNHQNEMLWNLYMLYSWLISTTYQNLTELPSVVWLLLLVTKKTWYGAWGMFLLSIEYFCTGGRGGLQRGEQKHHPRLPYRDHIQYNVIFNKQTCKNLPCNLQVGFVLLSCIKKKRHDSKCHPHKHF